MTLASRFSTQVNLGLISDRSSTLSAVLGNFALTQAQAIIVGFLASVGAIALRLFTEREFDLENSLVLIAGSVSTASFASLILAGLMMFVIILSKRVRINPDNVATPIAASLGDLVTLSILSLLCTFLYQIRVYTLFQVGEHERSTFFYVNTEPIRFYSILFYFILFYSILFLGSPSRPLPAARACFYLLLVSELVCARGALPRLGAHHSRHGHKQLGRSGHGLRRVGLPGHCCLSAGGEWRGRQSGGYIRLAALYGAASLGRAGLPSGLDAGAMVPLSGAYVLRQDK